MSLSPSPVRQKKKKKSKKQRKEKDLVEDAIESDDDCKTSARHVGASTSNLRHDSNSDDEPSQDNYSKPRRKSPFSDEVDHFRRTERQVKEESGAHRDHKRKPAIDDVMRKRKRSPSGNPDIRDSRDEYNVRGNEYRSGDRNLNYRDLDVDVGRRHSSRSPSDRGRGSKNREQEYDSLHGDYRHGRDSASTVSRGTDRSSESGYSRTGTDQGLGPSSSDSYARGRGSNFARGHFDRSHGAGEERSRDRGRSPPPRGFGDNDHHSPDQFRPSGERGRGGSSFARRHRPGHPPDSGPGPERHQWGKPDQQFPPSDGVRGFGRGRGGAGRGGPGNPPKDKKKPNLGLSGALAEDTNTYNGVVVKYNEPGEARKPRIRWRLYPFKAGEDLPVLYIHRQSAYLLGRDRRVCDIAIDHPSASKQHAVLQYRFVAGVLPDGTRGGPKRVKPYVIDLGSANGTFLNNNRIDAQRYVELREKDVLKFGFSSREYVLLNEKSYENYSDEGADDDDDDSDVEVKVKVEPAE